MAQTQQPYRYTEFPRVVYGPGGENMVIGREDERPDGWVDHPDDLARADAENAAVAKREAKEAEKALRDEYKSFLDSHNVEYAKNLGTDKLADLVKQLQDHLDAQILYDDNGE